jgi:hypothetical protein
MNTPIMKPTTIKLLTLLLVAIIFDRLFWHESIGINLALFTGLVGGVVVYDRGWSGLSVPARISGAGLALSATMLVVYGSTIATFATFSSLFLFTALAHAPAIRTVTSGLAQWLVNLVCTPLGVGQVLGDAAPDTPGMQRSLRWVRIGVLPLLITALFFLLYRGGNSRFDALSASMLDGAFNWIGDVLEEVFTAHTFFFLFGLLLCASLVIRFAGTWIEGSEALLSNAMQRVRMRRPKWLAPLAMGALDKERRMGLVLLFLLNAMLLVVNVIDVNWVWLNFSVEPGMSLKEFVHEGTWLLIISIVLGMAVLLRLFRGNLNFHRGNRTLVMLATAWLAQNFILGISVFLRNYHYIAFHGLAYKRIGVIVFLLLLLVGLITLYIKVRQRKTFFYLLRVNGWAAFAVMVCLTTMDWDSTIVRYNLSHSNQGEIDIDNYLAMSDKVLPLLVENLDVVREQMAKHRMNKVRWVEHLDPAEFDAEVAAKRDAFLQRYREQHWQSWTLADSRTFAALGSTVMEAH